MTRNQRAWIAAAPLAVSLAVIAWAGFDGYQTATMNLPSFSQVAFAFAVTPRLLVWGLLAATVMGLLGGLLPAYRAARVPVVSALRQL